MVENTAPAPTELESEPDVAVDIAAAPLIEEELVIEDVSIDGMCGVY
jgi:mycofactocin precursor